MCCRLKLGFPYLYSNLHENGRYTIVNRRDCAINVLKRAQAHFGKTETALALSAYLARCQALVVEIIQVLLVKRVDKFDGGPHEAAFLKLDSSKVHSTFGFKNVWHIDEVMDKIIEWNINYFQNKDVLEYTQKQIKEFVSNLQCI